jgi:hypothetical protein
MPNCHIESSKILFSTSFIFLRVISSVKRWKVSVREVDLPEIEVGLFPVSHINVSSPPRSLLALCLGQDGGRDSAVGIASGYGLDNRGVGVRVPVGSRIFSSPRRPDRL